MNPKLRQALEIIAKIPWWLLYCAFNLHDKAYATRRLRDWEHVPIKTLGYALGWSFWVVLVIILFFFGKMLA